MIEKTDFPYTLGGYVEQQNYKGFDIAVSIRRYKGISAYFEYELDKEHGKIK